MALGAQPGDGLATAAAAAVGAVPAVSVPCVAYVPPRARGGSVPAPVSAPRPAPATMRSRWPHAAVPASAPGAVACRRRPRGKSPSARSRPGSALALPPRRSRRRRRFAAAQPRRCGPSPLPRSSTDSACTPSVRIRIALAALATVPASPISLEARSRPSGRPYAAGPPGAPAPAVRAAPPRRRSGRVDGASPTSRSIRCVNTIPPANLSL